MFVGPVSSLRPSVTVSPVPGCDGVSVYPRSVCGPAHSSPVDDGRTPSSRAVGVGRALPGGDGGGLDGSKTEVIHDEEGGPKKR